MSEKTPSAPSGNNTLSKAKSAKQDEFYTQLVDIENELKHYREMLKGKVILCNCDDPFESNFFKYFALNFNSLGLKKLIATSYLKSPIAGMHLSIFDIEGLKPDCCAPYAIEINEVPDHDGDGATDLSDVEYLLRHNANTTKTLKADENYRSGDFRSRDCIALLRQADIVATNPPFSLFREFVELLTAYQKQFLIIGNQNSITYKEIFKLIQNNELWLGVDNGGTKWFRVPDDYDIKTESRKKLDNGVKYFSMGSIMWFTNIDNPKRHREIPLFKNYNSKEYPKYDNYNAIEVSRVAEIPVDYMEEMGVPITFLDKHNPDQFEIVGATESEGKGFSNGLWTGGVAQPMVRGRRLYKRLFIKRRG